MVNGLPTELTGNSLTVGGEAASKGGDLCRTARGVLALMYESEEPANLHRQSSGNQRAQLFYIGHGHLRGLPGSNPSKRIRPRFQSPKCIKISPRSMEIPPKPKPPMNLVYNVPGWRDKRSTQEKYHLEVGSLTDSPKVFDIGPIGNQRSRFLSYS